MSRIKSIRDRIMERGRSASKWSGRGRSRTFGAFTKRLRRGR